VSAALDTTAAAPAEWTILVYMAANNNLAEAADACLRAMESATFEGAVNVVVEVRRPGRSPGGPTTTRYRVRGGDTESIPMVPSPSMGRPETLTDFINWGLATCPAKRSLLVVWGHATGLEHFVSGVSIPPVSGVATIAPGAGVGSIALDGSDSLTNQALRKAIAASAGGRVDVLGCDACLMSMVEIAYEVRGVAGFLVAAETEQPSQSWPYATFLAALREAPTMPPAELATTLVREFHTWYGDPSHENDLGYATQTAVDLAATKDLVTAIDALAAVLEPRLPLLEQLRPDLATMEIPDYIDLGDFLDQLDQIEHIDAEEEVVAATQRARRALEKARLDACGLGKGATGATGLSIYFPTPENAARFPGYRDLAFAVDTRWPELLRAFAASRTSIRAA
jgi:hypothetical protein